MINIGNRTYLNLPGDDDRVASLYLYLFAAVAFVSVSLAAARVCYSSRCIVRDHAGSPHATCDIFAATALPRLLLLP